MALSDLPREISGIHLGMPQHLLKADMRLIPIAVLLTWSSLKVYEEVDVSTECLQVPYEGLGSRCHMRVRVYMPNEEFNASTNA